MVESEGRRDEERRSTAATQRRQLQTDWNNEFGCVYMHDCGVASA